MNTAVPVQPEATDYPWCCRWVIATGKPFEEFCPRCGWVSKPGGFQRCTCNVGLHARLVSRNPVERSVHHVLLKKSKTSRYRAIRGH